MKRLFMFLLSIGFPWIILLMDDNPGGALVALIMQATIIGWIPAAIWARRIVKEKQNEEKIRKAKKAAEKISNE